MSNRCYSIEVDDFEVLIYGNLTVEEAFDFINFFEGKGYVTISPGDENSTLRMIKMSMEELKENSHQAMVRSDENVYKEKFQQEQKKSQEFLDKIAYLEKIIMQFTEKQNNLYRQFDEEKQRNLKYQQIMKLKEDPLAMSIMEQFNDTTA